MAIKDIGGRQVSIRTHEEDLALLEQDIAELSSAEREALGALLQEAGAGADGPGEAAADGAPPAAPKKTLLDYATEAEYERPVVGIKEWLEDPYYFGEIAKGLYPKLKEDLIELFTGDYHEVVLSGSIGWGKSTFGDIALGRQVYELSCLRNPQGSLGLQANSQIVFAGISITEKVAQRVLFEGVAQMFEISPYFQKEFKPEQTQDMIRFPKNIRIIPAGAGDNALIGLNIVGAVQDESNFMEFTQQQKAAHARWGGVDKASKLYAGLARRMKSRFLRGGKLPGLLMLVSSKKNTNSFTERKVAESQDNPRIFVREYALWDVKKFGDKKFRVLVGTEDASSRILADDEVPPEAVLQGKQRMIEVPVEFRQDFEDALEDALRDLAGVATDALRPFFRNREKLAQVFRKDRQPPRDTVEWDPTTPLNLDWRRLCTVEAKRRMSDGRPYEKFTPKVNPSAARHIHIDPSLADDATGFVVGHVAGMREVVVTNHVAGTKTKEMRPIIFVDLVLRIIPPERGREIPLEQIRQLIYALTKHGFSIGLVTMDTYQSADMRQTLVSQGYSAEVLSVDTSPAPYETAREAAYQGRLDCYHVAFLEKEMRQLEWDPRRQKVDHPPGGSKDLADALAGMTFTLTTRAAQPVMVASFGVSEAPKDDFGDLSWVLPTNAKGQPMTPKDPAADSGRTSWVPLLPMRG